MFFVNTDNRKGLHWFVFAIDCRGPVWAFKVDIWEPLSGTFLVRPMFLPPSSKSLRNPVPCRPILLAPYCNLVATTVIAAYL